MRNTRDTGRFIPINPFQIPWPRGILRNCCQSSVEVQYTRAHSISHHANLTSKVIDHRPSRAAASLFSAIMQAVVVVRGLQLCNAHALCTRSTMVIAPRFFYISRSSRRNFIYGKQTFVLIVVARRDEEHVLRYDFSFFSFFSKLQTSAKFVDKL